MANRRRKRFTPPLARASLAGGLAVVAATLVAGCGGSSGPTTASYDKQVGAICTRYEKQVKALTSGSSQTQAEAWISHTYGILQTVNTKIDKLKEPSSHADIDAAKGAQAKVITDLAAILKSVKAGNVSAFETQLTAFEHQSASAGTAWTKAGVKACGS